MANQTVTLKPPSLSQVLASNTIQSTPTTTPTTTPTREQISAANKAQLAENQRLAAARRNQSLPEGSMTNSGYVMDEKDSSDSYINTGRTYQLVDTAGNIFTGADPQTAQINANKFYAQYGTGPNALVNPRLAAQSEIKSIDVPKQRTIQSNTINGIPRTNVGKYTSSFKDALKTSRSRKEYEDSINYMSLTPQMKKIADRSYSAAEKSGILLPPKDMYENRADILTAEQQAQKEMLDKQKADLKAAEDAAKDAEDSYISQQEADTTNERDTFISEQEKLAADTESNRLNQVRGNIMQVLAARGVDISKLSPEQIVALSGEQGAKAFMDITEVRERTKSNIKQARDAALARLNDLRNRKAISKSTYERNVANINSQAEAASLNADRTASANIFALTQTKTEQGRTDATQRANAVTNIASMLGLSGTQIAPVLNLINTSGTGPEQLVAVAKMISDTNSPLRKSLDANMTATQQAALQKQLLEQYKAETDRIRASRSGGSGGSVTETVQI